jgi:hypothetical protein
MNALGAAAIVFAFVFGGAVLGMLLRGILPAHHLNDQGPMVVETRAPREVFELNPGDTCIVLARRAHHVMARMAVHVS